MKKKLLKIALILVIVLVVIIGVAIWQIGSIAKIVMERGTTAALGVPTQINDVDISLIGGSVKVSGLEIQNTPDFETPALMKVGGIIVDVESGSLLSDVVVVSLIEMRDMEVFFEAKGTKNNFKPILVNLREFKGAEDETEKDAVSETSDDKTEDESAKRFVVDRLVLAGMSVHVDVSGMKKMTVKLPDIELTDLTDENAGGVLIEELVGKIVPLIMAETLRSVADLPIDLVKDIGDDVLKLGDTLGQDAIKILGQGMPELFGDAVGTVGKEADKTLKNIDKTLNEAGEKLKGLFGGKKKDNEKENE